EIAARRETLLMAPIDGVVAALTAAPGQDVAPGRALVQILPEGAVFEATLFVPSRAIGFVVPGQDVGIRYDAFPHERFGVFPGRVAAVTRTVIAPEDAPPQLPLNVPAYRVTVALEDQSVSTDDLAAPLQAGMRLQASIALERRSLLDWLLAPLMKSTGSLK
ncbi:MAG: HlyD family efflux transporter periplasmic adaptor subunit, partial [Pseudomonadota bacterium]